MEKNYEHVNHPQHYNNYRVEVIEMMLRIYGKQAVIDFCEMNAFKYRMRAGTKPEQDTQRDFDKEKWYLDYKQKLEQDEIN